MQALYLARLHNSISRVSLQPELAASTELTMRRLALLAAAATALQRPPVIRRVEVEVTRQLDGVSPEHAREAWLDYSWTSGGGIPALILREPADAKLPSVRTLVPAGLREELAYVDETADEELVARYRVSDPGPLLGLDVVNGSHTGLVAFAPVSYTHMTLPTILLV